jgi:N4-gp56 family major capsid protein
MAVNLAKKYQKAIDQVYTLGSLTKSAFGGKFDFIGSKTAVVYTLTTQALGDYTRTGANRYGTPTELQDTITEYAITKDRSFSTTIDKGNYLQGNLVKTTGAFLKAEMNEIAIPEFDTYNLTVLYASATTATQVTTVATTASNAYTIFLGLQEKLDDNKVPVNGRIAFVKPSYYNFIKLDGTFIKASELGQKMLINGQVGEIDGVKIVKVPSSYFPANVNVILTHPGANVNPMQLEDINTHEDPPGISGALIEGRFIYDSFTFASKIKSAAANKIV